VRSARVQRAARSAQELVRHVDAGVGEHALAAVEHRRCAGRLDPRRRARRAEAALFFGTVGNSHRAARVELALERHVAVVAAVVAALAAE
jgi:hypothetical protein